MRAARLHGNKDVRVEDVPIPKPGPNQCLVEVEWCGICGSDLHEYVAGAYGDLVRWALDSSHRVILPQKYERLLIKTGPLMTPIVDPETGEARPASLGHEFCGRLKSVPTGSQLEVGQAVMVDPHCICHQCACCTSGSDNLCQKLGFLGGTPNLGGGLSEFVAVEERHCHALPDNVDLENAAVIEPMVVCHHAAKAAGVKLEGLDVLILGGGPVGTALISILKAHLVGKIFLSEPTAKRKEQNKDSVDITIDPKTENVGDVCRKLTGGKGVDVVFDCAGVQVGLEAGFDAVKHAGVFVNVAVWEKPVCLRQNPMTPDTDIAIDTDPVLRILAKRNQRQELLCVHRG